MLEISLGVSGSTVFLSSLGAFDLQSLVTEGSRATLSNTGNLELAMDIYSKFAKSIGSLVNMPSQSLQENSGFASRTQDRQGHRGWHAETQNNWNID